jgi:hypothetical protein
VTARATGALSPFNSYKITVKQDVKRGKLGMDPIIEDRLTTNNRRTGAPKRSIKLKLQ